MLITRHEIKEEEEAFRPIVAKFSAHQLTNKNDLKLIDFAFSKNMAVLNNERHFSDIIEVKILE